jgi:hypothetical protein
MTESDDSPAQPLPDELASALRRTTKEALTALLTLRIAIRDHVRDKRARGATLTEIDRGLKDMIEIAGDSDGDGDSHSPERIAELRTYVLKLSDAFYFGRGGPKKV